MKKEYVNILHFNILNVLIQGKRCEIIWNKITNY